MSKSLIFIAGDTPWVWSADYVQQTALELARRGNVVLSYMTMDGNRWKDIFNSKRHSFLIKKVNKNLYLYNPFQFVPLRRFNFTEKVNFFLNMWIVRLVLIWLAVHKRSRKKIFWSFDSNLLDVFKRYYKKQFLLLFDCVDFHADVQGEKLLCESADLVVANSQVLQRHLQKYRKDVSLVPQGFRLKDFKVDNKNYVDLKLTAPIIGFVGGINNRLDMTLLLPLIKNNPDWRFVLWGPIQKDFEIGTDRFNLINKVMKLPNVRTGESHDRKEIPGLISQFDIGIIPYDISQDFNKYCYPMKLFEFFYMGKPVVSTDVIELRRFPGLVMIGNNAREWKIIIKRTLAQRWPEQKMQQEKRLAQENSWENKIETIADHLGGSI